MQIVVHSVQILEGEVTIVGFNCAVGGGVGTWVGKPPAPGDSVFIEFDTSDELRVGENVLPSSSSVPTLRTSNGRIELVACLLEKHIEGTALFGFGDGRLLIEVTDADPFWKETAWYRLVLRDLRLYDMGL